MTFTKRFSFDLPAEFGPCDVTSRVADTVRESGVATGIACVQLVGSTGAVTTIEYEPGALEDLHRAVEQLAPASARYAHNERWHDGNGFSHVRSALLKTGVSIPVVGGTLQLGTWQQVVAINMDNRPRSRDLIVVVVGDEGASSR
jgi:secondary thiamine-phosphate synthase enzyme